jgi:HD-GYP domain-containing protein (c-di-GMP phosphodiesterase class II)
MTTVSRAELMAALSIGTDLALGLPLESGLATCLVASGLAAHLGLGPADARTIYHLALVRHIGCTADTHEVAAVFGSEIGLHELLETQDFIDVAGLLGVLEQHMRAALPTEPASTIAGRMPTSLALMRNTTVATCEVGAMLADRFGYGPDVRFGLLASYERWDGLGIPGRLAGAEIPLAVRIVLVAGTAVAAYRHGEDPSVWLRARSGTLLDPDLVDKLADAAADLVAGLEAADRWDDVIAHEPAPRDTLSGPALDTALAAIGEFADLKSPYLVGHSAHVATLAGDAASIVGLDDAQVAHIRRAGWIHDLGRVAVSSATWGRPGPLSRDEWEHVRLHPYFTDRVLHGVGALEGISSIATLHHERIDGTGYARALPAGLIPFGGRLLAVADVYAAMTEPRPHRAALDRDAAARELRAELQAGRLDGVAVQAVLEAAGHRRRRRREATAGLTGREIEVLGLLARGRTNRQIAEALVVSLKTVDAHVQHVYAKAGVTTRAGATLFATHYGLVQFDVGL